MAPLYDRHAIKPEEYVEAFEKYIESGAQISGDGKDITNILDEIIHEDDVTVSYPIQICVLSVLNFNQQLGTLLIHFPESIIQFLNKALMSVQIDYSRKALTWELRKTKFSQGLLVRRCWVNRS